MTLDPSSSSSKPTAGSGSSTPSLSTDAELDKLLSREASAFQRELEVDRILKAFKLKFVVWSPYLSMILLSEYVLAVHTIS
jgi:hypothetical protein